MGSVCKKCLSLGFYFHIYSVIHLCRRGLTHVRAARRVTAQCCVLPLPALSSQPWPRRASPGGFSGRAVTSLWHAPALPSRYLGTPSLFAPGSPCVLSDARNPGPCYWRIALGNRDVGPGCDGRSWNAAAPGRQRQDVGECSRTCLSTIPCYPPVLICTKLNVSSLQRLWLSSAASSPVVFNPRLPTERSLAPTIRHPLTYLHA